MHQNRSARRQIAPIVACVISLACVAGLLSAANTLSASTPPQPIVQTLAQAGTVLSTSETLTPTFLPMVSRDACPIAGTIASPFGLEIAALHQIVPTREAWEQEAKGLGAAQRQPSALLSFSDEAFANLVQALAESGAGWARVRVAWWEMQPAEPPAAYQKLDWYDQRLAQVAGTGVRMIVTVADAPAWAANPPCAPIDAGRLDEFAQFLGDLVNRYKGPPYNVKHWELTNEPDGTWSSGWAGGLGCWADDTTDEDGRSFSQMLAMASWAIKNADPEAMVLMGGVAHDWFTEYGGPFDRYFPDDVMVHGGGRYIDALNIHYFADYRAEWERWDPNSDDQKYGWLPPPTCGDLFDGQGTTYEAWGVDLHAKATHYRNRMATCFGIDKPLWVTELAEHGYPDDPISLILQARYVIQGYARGLAAGVVNITWYALTTPNDTFEQGLLYEDWSPKPGFIAYQTLTAELTGFEYVRTLNEENVEGYVFREPCGIEKTVVWGSGSLAVPAGRARIVDRTGTVRFVQDGGPGDMDRKTNGSVQLQLSDEPIFVSAAM